MVTGDTSDAITTARMVHIGESSASGHDLLRGSPDAEEQNAQGEAEHFLRVELAEGPRPAGEMENEARKIGIAKTTLWRARKKLGIEPDKDSFGGPWTWALPAEADKAGDGCEGVQGPEDSTFDGVEPSEGRTPPDPHPDWVCSRFHPRRTFPLGVEGGWNLRRKPPGYVPKASIRRPRGDRRPRALQVLAGAHARPHSRRPRGEGGGGRRAYPRPGITAAVHVHAPG